ncbi:hypothetical protein WKW50_16385 [Ochrobactrum sp. GPK 3]
MSDLKRTINKAFASKKKGITIWARQGGGFQANVQHEDGSWTVEYGELADGALEKALNTALAFPRHKAPRAPGARDEAPKNRRSDDFI